MEILAKAFDALWQVLLVGLLLGVGLPALFALGVRSLNSNRVLVSVGAAGEEVTKPSAAGAGGCGCLLRGVRAGRAVRHSWSSSTASNCSGFEPHGATSLSSFLTSVIDWLRAGLPGRDSRAGLRTA